MYGLWSRQHCGWNVKCSHLRITAYRNEMVIGDNTTAAAFIGASVTLVLIIIFLILMVILVRQCIAFMAKRNAIRQQLEQHRQQRAEIERQRRLSISEPVNPTFDWHHSIRIAGTPPPSYGEAKKLPSLEPEVDSLSDTKKDENAYDDNLYNSEENDDEKLKDNKLASMSDTVIEMEPGDVDSNAVHVSENV